RRPALGQVIKDPPERIAVGKDDDIACLRRIRLCRQAELPFLPRNGLGEIARLRIFRSGGPDKPGKEEEGAKDGGHGIWANKMHPMRSLPIREYRHFSGIRLKGKELV